MAKNKKKNQPTLSSEEKAFMEGQNSLRDFMAPASFYVDSKYVQVGSKFVRTIYVTTYPRFLVTGWFAPIITLDYVLDVSMQIYPMESNQILKTLRVQVTRFQAQMNMAAQKGLTRDPLIETAYQDAEALRDALQQGTERFFKFGLYISVYADSLEDLNKKTSSLVSVLQTKMVYTKPCIFQSEQGFTSTLPLLKDDLVVGNNLNTSPLSTTFPFVSANISSNKGILYGINRHNNSLILFDRFSMENANECIFAKSGGGKSYLAKLEIIRNLMLGVQVYVIDPENEYSYLTEAVGGTFLKISLSSKQHINPFELPTPREDESHADLLKTTIAELMAMLKLMLEGTNMVDKLTAEEEAVLDRALYETYASKDITPGVDYTNKIIPTLSDLENILRNMDGGENLAIRLSKYTTGSFGGFINEPTNVNLDANLIVFNIRDMEDELRPLAMYVITHYIWKEVRRELRKRLLVVDEAWVMMKNDEAASFLFSLAKRARKYYLGLTTITQDIADFLKSEYGKAILTNSSIQILLKQSPASIDIIQQTFYLTEEEKYLLLESDVGEGIFFAGLKHAAIKVVASYGEDQIITSDPEQLLKIRQAKENLQSGDDSEFSLNL
jgi:conjugal transfer ATP-binding protein TraC